MNWKLKVIIFFILLGVSVGIHRQHIFSFPSGIHSWSQTDHLALAHGFVMNGFNFFLPQTYMFNKVYTIFDNGVTAVDFPINNYITAAIMKISGDHSVTPFRLYMLIYSCVGLLFLFQFAFQRSKNYLFSAVAVVMVFGSAVFLDYQDGFIPSITALSNVFIAAYYLNFYWQRGGRAYFNLAILFLSLAALVRTPFALFLIALLGESIFRHFINKSEFRKKEWMAIVLGLIVPVLYFLYNSYLRQAYGSLFLSKPLPPHSWNEVTEVVELLNDRWVLHYWSLGIYLAFGLSLLLTIFLLVKSRSRFFCGIVFSRLAVWLLISAIGGLAYMFLMFKQFAQHDYYILDSLFGVAILIFATLMAKIHLALKWKNILLLTFAALAILGFRDSLITLNKRRVADPTSIEQRAFLNYQNANALLARLGIGGSEKVLVPDTYAPNLPMVVMQRDGYSVPYPTSETISTIMDWNWDYVLLQDYLVEKLFAIPFPQHTSGLERIGGDGRISVCKRKHESLEDRINIPNWFNTHAKTPFKIESSFTTWDNFIPHDVEPNKGWVKADSEYDLSFSESGLKSQAGVHLLVQMNYSLQTLDKDIFITVVVEESDKSLTCWQAQSLTEVDVDNAAMRQLNKLFVIPELKTTQKLMVSIWNPGKNEMVYNDLKISFYEGSD